MSDVTAVILTLDEEVHLERCLRAIPNDIPVVIVDSGSTDETLSIAKKNGCQIFERSWSGFADQRNFALNECGIKTGWVLFVDADEVFTESFYEWMRSAITRNGFDAAMVPSQLIFNGTPLRFAPGYPVYHPRLVRRTVTFVSNHTGHGESVAEPVRLSYAPYGYKHYFFDGDFYSWALKHVILARQELNIQLDERKIVTFRSRLSFAFGASFLRFALRFIYHYFFRAGFMDGRAGLNYSIMYSWYEYTKFLLSRTDA